MSYESPRLYVGNLPYVAQKEDIENLFREANIEIKKVDISIDPESGRNPSYCFVEFQSQEDATTAMNSLQGINLQGRALRINPKTDRRTGPNADRPAYQPRGWGPRVTDGNENSNPNNRWNRDEARPQWNAPVEDPLRVYVGGLNSGSDQETLTTEMKTLFEGYEVTSVGKLITPQSAVADQNSSFCFVEVATPAQAVEAVRNLNGRPTPQTGVYRVSHAKGKRGPAVVEREQPAATSKVFISGLPHIETQEELDHQIRELFAGLQINEIGKLITPHESRQTESGNHHYCFATFDRQEEAQRGVEAMNGQPTPNGGTYRISFAKERPAGSFGQGERFQQREGGYQNRGGFQQRDGGDRFQQREGGTESPRRQQREQQQQQGPPVNRDFGSSWRRRD